MWIEPDVRINGIVSAGYYQIALDLYLQYSYAMLFYDTETMSTKSIERLAIFLFDNYSRLSETVSKRMIGEDALLDNIYSDSHTLLAPMQGYPVRVREALTDKIGVPTS